MHLDFGIVTSALPYLWKGFQYTVQLTATAALGGLFFGTLLALARLSPLQRWQLPSRPAADLVLVVPAASRKPSDCCA